MLILENPVQMRLPDLNKMQLSQVEAELTYQDQKIIYEIQRHKKSGAWRFPDEKSYTEELERLKSLRKVSLLQKDEQGYWTYSGFLAQMQRIFGPEYEKKFSYPEPKLLPWSQTPDKTPYPYQEQALEALLQTKHAGVEMGTGLGKSFIIALLIKRLGLKTLVMAPSTSIAEQLYNEFSKAFGIRYVGAYYGTKKKPDKLIVIGNSQSLTRVEEGSPAWNELQKTQVFIADESHQCPAKTLASVCFGAAKNAPYRFFFSATQLRNDGAGPLLNAITGPIVYKMTVREGVDGNYLTRPKFHMVSTPSNGKFRRDDPMAMTRHHLYYNQKVAEYVGNCCNAAAKAKRPILVLIEEVEQFAMLLPYLRYEAEFAHGPLAANKSKVPQAYWESDPNEQVRKFDEGKVPILVGTSCISTGTDVRSPQFLIYWQGGKSEIQVRQAVGRGTRKFPGKNACHVIDFAVRSPSGDPFEDNGGRWGIGYHAEERRKIYDDLYGPVTESSID